MLLRICCRVSAHMRVEIKGRMASLLADRLLQQTCKSHNHTALRLPRVSRCARKSNNVLPIIR